MYTDLGFQVLKTGDRGAAARIDGPDLEWADRIEALLQHKGDPWNWQNAALLRETTGLGAHFFVLHREGVPFSNIMVVEHAGIGLLAHVWTAEPHRRTGASSILMELAKADFRARGGQMLYLGTDFGSAPWHYYRRRGFEPIAAGSGYMRWAVEQRGGFVAGWFGESAAEIDELDWPDWPTSAPLFAATEGGSIRIAATQLLGPASSEAPLLPFLRARRGPAAGVGAAFVLRGVQHSAVLGFASAAPDPLWPGTAIVDVFCHRSWWHEAGALLARLGLEKCRRAVGYVDATQVERREALERAGFRQVAALPAWLEDPDVAGARLNVAALVRE